MARGKGYVLPLRRYRGAQEPPLVALEGVPWSRPDTVAQTPAELQGHEGNGDVPPFSVPPVMRVWIG